MSTYNSICYNDLPYRSCAGAMVVNKSGSVFVGQRLDQRKAHDKNWQMPQGGIEDHEDPAQAVLREVREETGIVSCTIINQSKSWLSYDFPKEIISSIYRGKYKGQKQIWFLILFQGEEREINLAHSNSPEFGAWRWVEPSKLPELAIPFKKKIYQLIAEEFSPQIALITKNSNADKD